MKGILSQMCAEVWSGELSLLENAPHSEPIDVSKEALTGVSHVKENSRRRCPALFYLTVVYLSVNPTESLALCVQPSYKTQNCTSQKWFTLWRCGIGATTPGSDPHHVGPRGWTAQAVVAFGYSPLSVVPISEHTDETLSTSKGKQLLCL